MLNLQTLNLSQNNVGNSTNGILPLISLEFIQSDITVDLSFNRIKTVNLQVDRTLVPRTRPYNLNLTGNPFSCDCWATELKQKLENKLNNIFEDLFTLGSS